MRIRTRLTDAEWSLLRRRCLRRNELVMAARKREGWEASPSAGVIDSQSVKTTESGGTPSARCFTTFIIRRQSSRTEPTAS